MRCARAVRRGSCRERLPAAAVLQVGASCRSAQEHVSDDVCSGELEDLGGDGDRGVLAAQRAASDLAQPRDELLVVAGAARSAATTMS
jgi:hypothetical protein